jgi:hypothetical protein
MMISGHERYIRGNNLTICYNNYIKLRASIAKKPKQTKCALSNMETSKGRYRSPPRGDESSKRSSTFFRVGRYGSYHKMRDEQKKKKETMRAEAVEEFSSYLRSQSLCLAILLHKLNPSLLIYDHLLLSGNVLITKDDLFRISREEHHELDDMDAKMISNHEEYMKENNLTISYSSMDGFGIAREAEQHFADYSYAYRRSRDLSIIQEEAYASGRGVFDRDGNLFSTLGLLGIMNHACNLHSSVDVQVDIDHTQKQILVSMKEKSDDIALTWNYAAPKDLDFTCSRCQLLSTEDPWEMIRCALRILEPYYTRLGYGKDRKKLQEVIFEDWLPYIPSLFRVYFNIGDSSTDTVEDPRVYFQRVLQASQVDITHEEMKIRLRRTHCYQDILLGLHIAALLFVYIE